MKNTKKINVCLRSDIEPGNYVINTGSQYIWKAEQSDLTTINEGVKNGAVMVSAVICASCLKDKASHDFNEVNEFLCTKCYNLKLKFE